MKVLKKGSRLLNKGCDGNEGKWSDLCSQCKPFISIIRSNFNSSYIQRFPNHIIPVLLTSNYYIKFLARTIIKCNQSDKYETVIYWIYVIVLLI